MPPVVAAISRGADGLALLSLSASTEVAMLRDSASLSQDDSTLIMGPGGASSVPSIHRISKPDDVIISPLLATLFLVLGVVVFLAVMLKRMTTRPELMQYPGQLKSQAFTYGSINLPLDEMYREHIERRVKLANYCQHSATVAKTRPTKFVSVSDMWKAKQSKNRRKIDKISEEPDENELIIRLL